MNDPENELGYYMGWFVALLLAVCGPAYFFWVHDRVSWCGSDDSNCFREWVAALGAWAAVPAASITVYFLWKQINLAVRTQKATARIHFLEEVDYANHIIDMAERYELRTSLIFGEITTNTNFEDAVISALVRIEMNLAVITREDIQRAIDVFYIPVNSKKSENRLNELIAHLNDVISGRIQTNQNDLKEEIKKGTRASRNLMIMLKKRAMNRIDRIQLIVNQHY